MKAVFSVSELRRRSVEIVDYVEKSRNPVTITQKGVATAVLLAPSVYAQIEAKLERLNEIKAKIRDKGNISE